MCFKKASSAEAWRTEQRDRADPEKREEVGRHPCMHQDVLYESGQGTEREPTGGTFLAPTLRMAAGSKPGGWGLFRKLLLASPGEAQWVSPESMTHPLLAV